MRTAAAAAAAPSWFRIERVLVVAAAVPAAAVLLAWQRSSHRTLLVHRAGPEHAPLSLLAAAFVAAWVLMALATMLPTTTALLRAVRTAVGGRTHQAGLVAATMAGMVTVWAAAGAVLAAVDTGLHVLAEHAGLRPPAAVGFGLVLVAAGVYQVSGFVARCARACRTPFGFLARRWTGGPDAGWQAWAVGRDYGASCLACCGGLMAVMCAAGMANPLVLVGLAVPAAVQKQAPFGARLARPVGIVMIGAGAWLLLSHAVTGGSG